MASEQIEPAPLCQTHQYLLVHQLGIPPTGPWRAAIIMATIALFQATTAEPGVYEKLGGDISRIKELGCLGCYRPDVFGELVDAGLDGMKTVGERYINKATAANES